MKNEQVKDVQKHLVSLKDENSDVNTVSIGVNWSRIPKPYFFSLIKRYRRVDLDVGIILFSKDSEVPEMIYYDKLTSDDQAVTHSGDDSSGDSRNDENDNETINVDLSRISPETEQLVFFLSAHKGREITKLPYCKVRIFSGDAMQPLRVYESLNLSKHKALKGKNTFIMGKMFRKTDQTWDYIRIDKEQNLKQITDVPEFVRKHFV